MAKPFFVDLRQTPLIMRKLFNHFLKGLLFIVPIALTVYILWVAIGWLDGLLPIDIPGLGLAIILGTTSLIGYLASLFFIEPFFILFERLVQKIPFISIIYSSLKDLMAAFVGEERRFDKAVLVTVNKESNLMKPGFITSHDLTHIGLPGMVSVYFPHSYNFSGNVYIVDKQNIEPIDTPSSEVMRFIVSGGVSGSMSLANQIK